MGVHHYVYDAAGGLVRREAVEQLGVHEGEGRAVGVRAEAPLEHAAVDVVGDDRAVAGLGTGGGKGYDVAVRQGLCKGDLSGEGIPDVSVVGNAESDGLG